MSAPLHPSYVHPDNVEHFKFAVEGLECLGAFIDGGIFEFESSIVPKQFEDKFYDFLPLYLAFGEEQSTLEQRPIKLSNGNALVALNGNGAIYPFGMKRNGNNTPIPIKFSEAGSILGSSFYLPAIQVQQSVIDSLALNKRRDLKDEFEMPRVGSELMAQMCDVFEDSEWADSRFLHPSRIIYHARELYTEPLTEKSAAKALKIHACAMAVALSICRDPKAEDAVGDVLCADPARFRQQMCKTELKPSDLQSDSEVFQGFKQALFPNGEHGSESDTDGERLSEADKEIRIIANMVQDLMIVVNYMMEVILENIEPISDDQ